MNKTALKAALSSLTFSAHLYRAMVNTAKRGYTVDHVNNRRGHACLAVRWDRLEGFTFTNKNGKVLDNKDVFKLLRAKDYD